MTVPPSLGEARRVLVDVFEYPDFRPGQGKAVRWRKTAGEGGHTAPTRSDRSKSRYGGDIACTLDNHRKRMTRTIGWRMYMVFQRRVMPAIDREEPDSIEVLSRISGLAPAKIERFGEDVLDLVRRNRWKDLD